MGLFEDLSSNVSSTLKGVGIGGDVNKLFSSPVTLFNPGLGASYELAKNLKGPKLNQYEGPASAVPLTGADDREKRFMEQIKMLQEQAKGLSPQNQQAQDVAMQGLMARAQGTAPSAADIMFQRQQEQNLANAMSLARSQRGVSASSAQRMAGQQVGQANQAALGQASAMRAQEQAQAQQQLLQQVAQQRQYQLQLQDLAKQYELMGLDQARAQMAAQQALQGMQFQASNANVGTQYQLLGGLLSGAGSVAGSMLGKPSAVAGPQAQAAQPIAGQSYTNYGAIA